MFAIFPILHSVSFIPNSRAIFSDLILLTLPWNAQLRFHRKNTTFFSHSYFIGLGSLINYAVEITKDNWHKQDWKQTTSKSWPTHDLVGRNQRAWACWRVIYQCWTLSLPRKEGHQLSCHLSGSQSREYLLCSLYTKKRYLEENEFLLTISLGSSGTQGYMSATQLT